MSTTDLIKILQSEIGSLTEDKIQLNNRLNAKKTRNKYLEREKLELEGALERIAKVGFFGRLKWLFLGINPYKYLEPKSYDQ